jgi:hypothetical protein
MGAGVSAVRGALRPAVIEAAADTFIGGPVAAGGRGAIIAAMASPVVRGCWQERDPALTVRSSSKGQVMGDRSGVGLVGLTVLETLGALTTMLLERNCRQVR